MCSATSPSGGRPTPHGGRTIWQRFILPITGHFRKQRAALLRRCFPSVDDYHVCDLGGSLHFWAGIADQVRPRHVDIINVSADAINVAGRPNVDADRFRLEIYDGSHIPRPDGHYDLLLCNSVIEHVPTHDRDDLATEMTRVAQRIFLQTPAPAFPIDPHFVMPFVHWLPRPIGRRVVRISPWRLMTRSTAAACDAYFDETRLLTRRELQRLFPAGTVHVERFLGIPKSYVLAFGQLATAQRPESP